MSYAPRGPRASRAPRRLPWATSVAGASGTRLPGRTSCAWGSHVRARQQQAGGAPGRTRGTYGARQRDSFEVRPPV
eukprot:9277157-Alexandrium_andersonii.AAC.1